MSNSKVDQPSHYFDNIWFFTKLDCQFNDQRTTTLPKITHRRNKENTEFFFCNFQ
jgi:hypothetical protein